MSRTTIVTCDGCGDKSDRAGFTFNYSFGQIVGASGIQRQSYEYDLCKPCFKSVCDDIRISVRRLGD